MVEAKLKAFVALLQMKYATDKCVHFTGRTLAAVDLTGSVAFRALRLHKLLPVFGVFVLFAMKRRFGYS